mgnify:CR=1 FL=1
MSHTMVLTVENDAKVLQNVRTTQETSRTLGSMQLKVNLLQYTATPTMQPLLLMQPSA